MLLLVTRHGLCLWDSESRFINMKKNELLLILVTLACHLREFKSSLISLVSLPI